MLKDNPAGKLGLMLNVNGATPPVAATGINELTTVFNGKSLDAIATFTDKGVAPPVTSKLNDAEAVFPEASENVTT